MPKLVDNTRLWLKKKLNFLFLKSLLFRLALWTSWLSSFRSLNKYSLCSRVSTRVTNQTNDTEMCLRRCDQSNILEWFHKDIWFAAIVTENQDDGSIGPLVEGFRARCKILTKQSPLSDYFTHCPPGGCLTRPYVRVRWPSARSIIVCWGRSDYAWKSHARLTLDLKNRSVKNLGWKGAQTPNLPPMTPLEERKSDPWLGGRPNSQFAPHDATWRTEVWPLAGRAPKLPTSPTTPLGGALTGRTKVWAQCDTGEASDLEMHSKNAARFGNLSKFHSGSRMLVRGASRVLTPGGLWAQNLLKIGGFPLKMPENCMI